MELDVLFKILGALISVGAIVFAAGKVYGWLTGKLEAMRTDITNMQEAAKQMTQEQMMVHSDLYKTLQQINVTLAELRVSLVGIDGGNGFRGKLNEINETVQDICTRVGALEVAVGSIKRH